MTINTTVPKCLFVLLMLLINYNVVIIASRPLNIIETGAMKHSGPSSRGKGHKLNKGPSLGGIKDSSGPSSGGVGHKATNFDTLSIGGIKNSGPSSGGKGH
ncbi:hypothetical protein PIB30_008106 [Stylosanthes scabra]|uniref:Uncharacterized protein n=1 Tax=Stylosanthes scabra TaxID=79078 RepID=A0ABU6X370_9FABA|nr:hypothetical protein [Stylosanthes scabra]